MWPSLLREVHKIVLRHSNPGYRSQLHHNVRLHSPEQQNAHRLNLESNKKNESEKGVALMLNTAASHDRPKLYRGRLSYFWTKYEDDLRF